ncbi:outer membrane protein transport protein [Pseudenterobacter timonensis]|uniref:Outer membrane protein transport protein n=1 Tax=Pseudenterobacter timonensis TaxID=1755099 RepID=A0AAE4DKH3_9ENTR|nr:outer membrane protein transport protein [Pseudenterobacter timonensis]MDR9889192.1 outer membrane protein transport protein [Pseudenterobacter timonensis]
MNKFIILCASVFISPLTHASALYFYETGTEDTALAGAGQAARAQDASTILTNPAGMTLLPDHMLTGGLQVLDGNIDYQLNDPQRNSPGDVLKPFPNASAFYSQRINDNLFAGIGLYGDYGLGLDYGDWAGDRIIKKSTLAAMTLSPSLAWKLNDRLSIGASANINYGFLSLTRSVQGDEYQEQDHDWAMSYRLGLLMALTDSTRAGVTWTSQTDYDFDIHGSSQIPRASFAIPLTAQISAPEQLMFSVVHDINPQWSVMGDLGWQDWSQFGAPDITVRGRQVDNASRMKDTWHMALGAQYRPSEKWRFDAGVAFDSTPYHDQGNVSMALPTGDEWRFGTGAQYRITPASQIGVAVEYLHMQSSHVVSPAIYSGRFDKPSLWFAGVSYSYQF